MSIHSTHPSLARLAARHGVAAAYETADDALCSADPAALVGVLRILGVDIASPDDAERILAAPEPEPEVDPVVVAWQGRGIVSVPGDNGRRFTLTIHREDGVEKTVDGVLEGNAIELPTLPLGYHRADLEIGGDARQVLIIAAPSRTHRPTDAGNPRRWGLFAPLHAIGRSTGSGCGDLRDLGQLCDVAAAAGGSFAGTLPLLSAFHDEPAEVSPYAPVSRLFWNPLYLDIANLPEFSRLPATSRERAIAGLAALRDGDHVDQPAIARHLQPILAEMTALAGPPASRQSAARPELADFARFRASRHGRDWREWPEAAAAGTLTEADIDPARLGVELYAHRAIENQLAALAASARARSVDLYLDLPVGSHPHGYDAWRYRDSFADGASCGAPPDLLFAGGQTWGFPPLHPRRARASGYPLIQAIVRNHCRYAGILRVDHVMWLHRIYWIPDGFGAKDGVYVHYEADELWAILCLESHRSETIIVGEDLGTVPDEVRAAMGGRGAAGMHLLQFGLGGDPHDAIREPPRSAVASLGSHDTPTFAAYWSGDDLRLATSIGFIDDDTATHLAGEREAIKSSVLQTLRDRQLIANDDPDIAEVTAAMLAVLASSPARFVMISIEDLWGELRPQNVPGTLTEVPNWTRRSTVAVDELADHPSLAVLAEVDRRRRAPPEPISLRAAAAREPRVRDDVSALSADDIHWWGEGTHLQAFDFLGAHPAEADGIAGTRFCVWAPNAERASVIGDWNGWDVTTHPLVQRQASGIWEGFVGGALIGDRYKFWLRSQSGEVLEKADPVAFSAEEPPRTAYIITNLDYSWGDDEWMSSREGHSDVDRPVSIYEVHLGSFMRVPEEGNRALSYLEAAERLADHVCALGFTHVELMPVMEHPFYGSWGYQTLGYFAPTARYGSPQDMMAFVDLLHQRGIGVILDWVPSHFPNDAHGLANFDGTHLFEHADPRLGFHPDWQSCIYNYGRNEVRSFLISSALFWLHQYHVDGIRVDAVASMLYRDYSRKAGEWIPNQYGGNENLEAVDFLRQLNEAIYSRFPGVHTYAEESTAWPGVSKPTFAGGLGFGYKWDMGWMHDTLHYLARDPIHRKFHQGELSFRAMYAFSENYVLSLSHDEVVHGKGSLLDRMPGDDWQRRANLRLLYGNMFASPGKKLLFMGQEFAQSREWSHETSLDWHESREPGHAEILTWVRDLNMAYRREPALHQRDCDPAGFQWIDHSDSERSIFSFLRLSSDEAIAVIGNYTPSPQARYRIGVPGAGDWRVILNSDAAIYGGSNVPLPAAITAEPQPWHGRSHSITLDLPPLAMVLLKHEP